MRKILLVDSCPDFHSLFSSILKPDNIAVDSSSNAEEMYKSLQLSTPDMLMIDVVRTGIDETVCQALRQRNSLKTVPIIIISTRREHIENFRNYGGDDAIEKPFDIETLRKKVQAFLQINN